MEEKKNNKTFILVLIGIIGLCSITIGLTYAYWILTRQQTGENVVNTACLNISFTGENDIMLDKAYPMNEEQLESFLSSATPYHFTINNECSDLASASINLESLTVSGKALEDEYIDAILYEDDYNTNLNTNKKLNTPNDENKVITDAKHAYSLYNFTLKANEEKDFNLLLYMDPPTPMVDANMDAIWKGKITLSAGYKEDSKALRKISSSDTNGMWGYKDKLTRIVIENNKNVKTAPDGGQVYGPYDESEYGTKAVESCVVCEADETNCVGYLQSEGKVIANSDSSYLFYNFKNATVIDGLENLNTSNVTNMANMFAVSSFENIDVGSFNTSNVKNFSGMFNGVNHLIELDISNFDTTNATSKSGMFGGMRNLQKLNLSNFVFPENCHGYFDSLSSLETLILTNADSSKIENMNGMFINLTKLQELDLSSFDTSNVTDMSAMFMNDSSLKTLNISSFDTKNVSNLNAMFIGTTSLQSIIFGPNFVRKQGATTESMFIGCGAPERPTGDTWSGVSFD